MSGPDIEAAKPGQDGVNKAAVSKSMNTSTSRRRPSLTHNELIPEPPQSRGISGGHLPLLSTKLQQKAPEPKLLHP